jgi:hypothetical protein
MLSRLKKGMETKYFIVNWKNVKKRDKAIPVTGPGGPYGCETSRFPTFSGKSAHRWR